MTTPAFTYPKSITTNLRALLAEQSRVYGYMRHVARLRESDGTSKPLRDAERTAFDYSRRIARMIAVRSKGWTSAQWKTFKSKPCTQSARASAKPKGIGPKAKAANAGRSLSADEIAAYVASKGFEL
jgi:hypothetical protein